VVPALSLQPLVENAVRHGVEPRAGTGRVEVVGRDLGDLDVELVVSDDGPGLRPEQVAVALDGSSGGIGLSNVHQRLQATFGPQYGLRVASREGAGTAVTMTLPKFRAGVRAA
jgi:two-component system LytT family sensor kinase